MSGSSDKKNLPHVVRAILDGTNENKIDRTTEKTNIDRTGDETSTPALELHGELQFAFKFLNDELFFPVFGVRLSDVMLTVGRSRYAGAFWDRTYEQKGARDSDISEILVSSHLLGSTAQTLQTIAHEMIHYAQDELGGIFGEPSPRGYHNKKFAKAMRAIGLQVANVNNLSRDTGYRMTDFIIDGGVFERALERYVEIGGTISWAMIREAGENRAAPPGGRPNSPTCGHLKIPHP